MLHWLCIKGMVNNYLWKIITFDQGDYNTSQCVMCDSKNSVSQPSFIYIEIVATFKNVLTHKHLNDIQINSFKLLQ